MKEGKNGVRFAVCGVRERKRRGRTVCGLREGEGRKRTVCGFRFAVCGKGKERERDGKERDGGGRERLGEGGKGGVVDNDRLSGYGDEFVAL